MRCPRRDLRGDEESLRERVCAGREQPPLDRVEGRAALRRLHEGRAAPAVPAAADAQYEGVAVT